MPEWLNAQKYFEFGIEWIMDATKHPSKVNREKLVNNCGL